MKRNCLVSQWTPQLIPSISFMRRIDTHTWRGKGGGESKNVAGVGVRNGCAYQFFMIIYHKVVVPS